MQSNMLSKATMGRLPLYLQFVRSVKTETVSSTAVAHGLGLGEVQVRKDLASVCPAGMPKVGYPAERLRSDLERVLGMKHTVPAVIVGAGKLGRALMEYDGFREYGMEISAAFDISGTDEIHEKIPILKADQMRRWCLLHDVHLGILAVPADAAQEAAETMADSGITAILNFAPCPVHVPEHVTVRQENIALSLAYLKLVACTPGRIKEED